MTGRATAAVITAALVIVMCCIGGLSIGAGGAAIAACTNPASASTPPAAGTYRPLKGRRDGGQVAGVATVSAVDRRYQVPPPGRVSVVANALREAIGTATVASELPRVASVDRDRCPSVCPDMLRGGSSPSAIGDCRDGGTVMARAATWLIAWNGGPVPYLSSADPATWLGGYRRDCSGYASMALGLAGPGLDTAALADRSTPISKADLHAGDLLINPASQNAGHVVIFDYWVDAAMTSYVGYEQSGDGGTHHRVIGYPYFGGYSMSPYRYGTG